MRRTCRGYGGWCCIIFVLAVAFLPPSASCSQTYEDAENALKHCRYEEAFDIFSRLFKERPEDQHVNFGLGLSALEVGKVSHAQFAFERVLMADPDNLRARLELGRTYYAMGLFELAREEFATVLAADPPPQVRQNVNMFLKGIERRLRRWNAGLDIQLTAFYDDNVNYGPSEHLIDTLLGRLELNPDSRARSAWGMSGSATASGTYDIGERGAWFGAASLTGYRSILDDASAQEISYGRGMIGLRRATARNIVDLPIRTEALEYGHDPLLRTVALDPSLHLMPTDTLRCISQANVEYRDYNEGSERDGVFLRLGQVLRKSFARNRYTLTLSLFGFYDDSRERAFENYGWEASMGGEATLGWRMTPYALLQYRRLEYREILYPTLQDSEREDNQFQLVLGVRKGITDRFGLDAQYRHVRNDSNFGLYEYERNVFSAGTYLKF